MENNHLTSVFISLRQRLKSVAAPIVGESRADDALQEAFCRLWQRREGIADRRAAEGLSIVTVRHVAIDERRRQQQQAESPLNQNVAATPAITPATDRSDVDERFEEVKRLIFTMMDERQANILWRREYQQWDFKDIAQEYGITEANVRQIVSRARKEIREIYRRQRK